MVLDGIGSDSLLLVVVAGTSSARLCDDDNKNNTMEQSLITPQRSILTVSGFMSSIERYTPSETNTGEFLPIRKMELVFLLR
jgi:hypothetical protein